MHLETRCAKRPTHALPARPVIWFASQCLKTFEHHLGFGMLYAYRVYARLFAPPPLPLIALQETTRLCILDSKLVISERSDGTEASAGISDAINASREKVSVQQHVLYIHGLPHISMGETPHAAPRPVRIGSGSVTRV